MDKPICLVHQYINAIGNYLPITDIGLTLTVGAHTAAKVQQKSRKIAVQNSNAQHYVMPEVITSKITQFSN